MDQYNSWIRGRLRNYSKLVGVSISGHQYRLKVCVLHGSHIHYWSISDTVNAQMSQTSQNSVRLCIDAKYESIFRKLLSSDQHKGRDQTSNIIQEVPFSTEQQTLFFHPKFPFGLWVPQAALKFVCTCAISSVFWCLF